MRYNSLLFTYLLTYLLTSMYTMCVQKPVAINLNKINSYTSLTLGFQQYVRNVTELWYVTVTKAVWYLVPDNSMPRSRVRGMLNFTTSMPFANTAITLIIIIIITTTTSRQSFWLALLDFILRRRRFFTVRGQIIMGKHTAQCAGKYIAYTRSLDVCCLQIYATPGLRRLPRVCYQGCQRSVFHGMSFILASLSRVPAQAFPGRQMSRFSAVHKWYGNSAANVCRIVTFLPPS